MKEILNCEGCVDEIEVNLNREITLAKEKADAASKPMRERISELEVQIRDFVSRHREELDGKSKRLNFGQTGFRLSTKLVAVSYTHLDGRPKKGVNAKWKKTRRTQFSSSSTFPRQSRKSTGYRKKRTD